MDNMFNVTKVNESYYLNITPDGAEATQKFRMYANTTDFFHNQSIGVKMATYYAVNCGERAQLYLS